MHNAIVIALILAALSATFASVANRRAKLDQLRYLALTKYLIEGARVCLYASALLFIVIATISVLRQR